MIGYLNTQTVYGPVDVTINGQIQNLQNMPQPGETDLCVVNYALGEDLAATGITVNPANPAPGSSATITATVVNLGDVPETDVGVVFYDGDPDSDGIQIGAAQDIPGPLAAGQSANLSTSWTVPTDGQSHTLYVVVDPDMTIDDRNWNNNIASTTCVLPDLIVVTGWSTVASPNTVAITTTIENQGVLAAGSFNVSWHVGSPGGPLIGTSPVDSLAAGASTNVTYLWTFSQPSTVQFIQVCAVANSSNTVVEMDAANNVGYQMVQAPSFEQPSVLSAGAAKLAPNDTAVNLPSEIVTAAFPGYLYVEEADRSSGIRVNTSTTFNVGVGVSVTGRLDSSGAELAIDADSVQLATTSGAIQPLGMGSRRLGGGALGLQAGIANAAGLNNIGLLVRIWGTTTQVGDGYLYIDDGSGLSDGTLTDSAANTGVRVVCDTTGYSAWPVSNALGYQLLLYGLRGALGAANPCSAAVRHTVRVDIRRDLDCCRRQVGCRGHTNIVGREEGDRGVRRLLLRRGIRPIVGHSCRFRRRGKSGRTRVGKGADKHGVG